MAEQDLETTWGQVQHNLSIDPSMDPWIDGSNVSASEQPEGDKHGREIKRKKDNGRGKGGKEEDSSTKDISAIGAVQCCALFSDGSCAFFSAWRTHNSRPVKVHVLSKYVDMYARICTHAPAWEGSVAAGDGTGLSCAVRLWKVVGDWEQEQSASSHMRSWTS